MPGELGLDLSPTLSIAGYVEGAPIVNASTVASSTVVVDSGWLVLSGLEVRETSQSTRGLSGGLGNRLTSDEGKRSR